MTDDEILARWEEVPWDNRQPHPRGIIAFARAIAAATVEKCIRAVDDAGGDNTQYHIDAIRARTAESESPT